MSTEKSNKIGVIQLTILTMVNMMGSGIIMLPTKLAEIGTISIVSWLVTAVGSTALAYAFAQCGMFSKNPAGWADMRNTLSEKPVTLWRIILMVFPWSSLILRLPFQRLAMVRNY